MMIKVTYLVKHTRGIFYMIFNSYEGFGEWYVERYKNIVIRKIEVI